MSRDDAVQTTTPLDVGGGGAFIRIDQVCKTFAARDGAPTVAVDNVDLHIGTAEFVSLLGPSGCGKSTLLSLVAGLIQPSSGTGRHRRGGSDRALHEHRHRVPERPAARLAHRARQRPGAVRDARAGPAPARGPRARADRLGRPGRLRVEVPLGALRRHAPARLHLPRADPRPAAAADGRAVRRARRADARAAAGRPAAHLAELAQDGAVRHPQHQRGRVPLRPRGGDDAAPGPHPRGAAHRPAAAARASTCATPRRSPPTCAISTACSRRWE